MLRSYWLLAGITAAAIGVGMAPGCGSSTESNTTAGTGAGTSSSSSSTSGSTSSGAGGEAEPPGPPAMTAPNGMGNVTFAISQLFLGDTDRCSPTTSTPFCTGTPDQTNGWKQYGFDIDQVPHVPPYTNLCKPVDNANAATVHQTGYNGIDNSFGANILQIITSISSDASEKINQGIQEGKFTIMLSLVDLGTGANYNPINTLLYAGSNLGMNPKFDGTDMWPVNPAFLNNPTDITSAKVQFPMSYVDNNTWVSGSKGTVNLMLSVDSFNLNLTISAAQIAFQMDPTHHFAFNGTIAGILNTQALITELQQVAGAFDTAFCDPNNTTFMSIADEIEQASDILSEGPPYQDPTKTCDGISIGLGFNAELVQLGGIGPASMGTANPCADAGAGGSGG